MKLYSTDHSPFVSRVRMAAYAKDIALDCKEPPEGPSSEAFRRISPLGMVPVLEFEDGTALPESEVIVEYLEDIRPEPALRPAEPAARARARLLARIADLQLAEPLRELYEEAKKPEFQARSVAQMIPRIRHALGLIDHYLDDGRYAVGTCLTTADCALVPLLFFVARCAPLFQRYDGSAPFGGLTRLSNYWSAIAGDPSARRTLDEMELSQQRRAAERVRHGVR